MMETRLDENTRVGLTIPTIWKLIVGTVGAIVACMSIYITALNQVRQVCREEVNSLRVEREGAERHLVTREEWLLEHAEVRATLAELKVLIVDVRERLRK